MGMIVRGAWTEDEPPETAQGGGFKRMASAFRHRITADGSSGFPAEPGRYHLYAGHHCPWAHRTIIFRALKKLEAVIGVSYCLPFYREGGWTFERRDDLPDCTADEAEGFHHLYEAYLRSDPNYTGKVTIPTLWDKKRGTIVSNESSEIIRMMNAEFAALAAPTIDYYPQALRVEIDELNELTYKGVNNGVYQCGFARSQDAYDRAYDLLFSSLDTLERRLEHRRYLLGEQQTEADWRLFPTLVRFDVAYFPLFKCNRQRLVDFTNLSRYTRDLYATPGIEDTVKPHLYIANYYSLERVNPGGIIPRGVPFDLGGGEAG